MPLKSPETWVYKKIERTTLSITHTALQSSLFYTIIKKLQNCLTVHDRCLCKIKRPCMLRMAGGFFTGSKPWNRKLQACAASSCAYQLDDLLTSDRLWYTATIKCYNWSALVPRDTQWLKWGGLGGSAPLLPFEPPAIVWAPLIESIKCYFMPK